MFKKILIANRGEIACRIIKTAKKMGIQTVAIYSTVDANCLHVKLADEAYCVGEAPAISSYLNIDAIISIAKKAQAEAIHPGYGFVSENADFARACMKAHIVFIGPTIEAIEIMGSKQRAKQLLDTTSIPLTPGYHGKDQSDETLLKKAIALGFPVLLKAANGGGGKGMRSVYKEEDFSQAISGARREAKASFSDDTMLIEKLIERPRHIEIQIMADNFDNVVHLYERDCSIQRRHQKIIEEAPAPLLSDSVRDAIAKAAIEVAKAIKYRGAGTVEFLLDKNSNFYFMEMNTRLQVEHPVTEMITGLDLVEWQLKIAANEPLPCSQKEITCKGHAIECRIYAEDPENHFLPSIGKLHFLKEPEGEGIRIDTGVTKNDSITQYYDPMIAKLISWGETRQASLERLQQALSHYHIGGVKTGIPFLKAVLHVKAFSEGKVSTDFLEQHPLHFEKMSTKTALFMAVSFETINLRQNIKDALEIDSFGWQMHLNHAPTNNISANQTLSAQAIPMRSILKRYWKKTYTIENEAYEVIIIPNHDNQFTLVFDNNFFEVNATLQDDKLQIIYEEQVHQAYIEEYQGHLFVYSETGPIIIKAYQFEQTTHLGTLDNQLLAPMPGTVVAILKSKGETVKAGDRLIILEAMKMEHTLHAPHDGILQELFFEVGAQVLEGTELARIEDIESRGTPS